MSALAQCSVPLDKLIDLFSSAAQPNNKDDGRGERKKCNCELVQRCKSMSGQCARLSGSDPADRQSAASKKRHKQNANTLECVAKQGKKRAAGKNVRNQSNNSWAVIGHIYGRLFILYRSYYAGQCWPVRATLFSPSALPTTIDGLCSLQRRGRKNRIQYFICSLRAIIADDCSPEQSFREGSNIARQMEAHILTADEKRSNFYNKILRFSRKRNIFRTNDALTSQSQSQSFRSAARGKHNIYFTVGQIISPLLSSLLHADIRSQLFLPEI